MTSFDGFLGAHPLSRHVRALSADDLRVMAERKTPTEVVGFLSGLGLAFFSGDFFATTLPHLHDEALVAAKQKPKDCFPFLRTAFGALIFLKKGKVFEIDGCSGKLTATDQDFDFYVNLWLTSETALDHGLLRHAYEKYAKGRAVLALDEHFVLEPRPTGAFLIKMGFSPDSDGSLKERVAFTAHVVKRGQPAPTEAEAKPKKKAPATPAPRDASSAIVDPNLKLAVVEALLSSGALALADLEAADPDAPDERIRRHYVELPLSVEQLDAVTSLHWGGGMSVQHAIFPDWDGEDELFDIVDFRGIDALTNLRELAMISAVTAEDLAPLGALTKLEKVKLPANYKGNRTLKALKKRGVEIG